MNKIANEDELVKKALQIGAVYAKKRAYGEIEVQDSVKLKVEFIYKVLVEDKLIQPLAKDQISDPNMRHKLALWISRQLPADHPLLTESTTYLESEYTSIGYLSVVIASSPTITAINSILLFVVNSNH